MEMLFHGMINVQWLGEMEGTMELQDGTPCAPCMPVVLMTKLRVVMLSFLAKEQGNIILGKDGGEEAILGVEGCIQAGGGEVESKLHEHTIGFQVLAKAILVPEVLNIQSVSKSGLQKVVILEQSGFDLVLIVNGRKEKIASGLLKPFLGHLKAAQDQIAKGGYSITLEPSSGFDEPWFTRGLTCLSDDGKVILPHPIGGCTTETAASQQRRQTQAQATTSGLDQRFGGDHAGETATEPAAGGLGSARRQRARRVDDEGHSDAVGRDALAVARDGRRAWLRRVRDGAASGDCGMGRRGGRRTARRLGRGDAWISSAGDLDAAASWTARGAPSAWKRRRGGGGGATESRSRGCGCRRPGCWVREEGTGGQRGR
ncbi:hypothetical protein ACP70R_037709 [Stipagrostis hirtigluma subsp. patula]